MLLVASAFPFADLFREGAAAFVSEATRGAQLASFVVDEHAWLEVPCTRCFVW